MELPPPMSTPARAQVRWNAAYGAELCRRATDRLYAAAGANANHDTNELQGAFRDINTSTHHAMLDFDTTLEMTVNYGDTDVTLRSITFDGGSPLLVVHPGQMIGMHFDYAITDVA